MKTDVPFCAVSMAVMLAMSFPAAAESDQLFQLLPDGISLGMTRSEMRPHRPQAKHSEAALSRKSNSTAFTEMETKGAAFTTYQYHFIGDRLRAVTMGVFHAGKREEKTVERLRSLLSRDYAKQADEAIIRLNHEMQKTLVTAELWKNEKTGVCAFFVDTAADTTAITFDPAHFSKKDFFITPEEMPGEIPGLETIRNAVDKARAATDRGQPSRVSHPDPR